MIKGIDAIMGASRDGLVAYDASYDCRFVLKVLFC